MSNPTPTRHNGRTVERRRSTRATARTTLLAAAIAWTIGGCSLSLSQPRFLKSTEPRTSLLAPVTQTRECRSRDGLPDERCTPGAVLSDTSLARICQFGYTRAIRPPVSFTEPLKRRLMAAYGYIDRPASSFELDHLVPLALGGAPRDTANLWPEKRGSSDGAEEKDRVETLLARAACSTRVSLRAAQRAIAANWKTALARLRAGRPG
jgi:hypothetical protein